MKRIRVIVHPAISEYDEDVFPDNLKSVLIGNKAVAIYVSGRPSIIVIFDKKNTIIYREDGLNAKVLTREKILEIAVEYGAHYVESGPTCSS